MNTDTNKLARQILQTTMGHPLELNVSGMVTLSAALEAIEVALNRQLSGNSGEVSLPVAPAGAGVPAQVAAVAEHMERSIEFIEKAYPNARMLDRGPILRNIRRWARKLRDSVPEQRAVPVPMLLYCPACGTQHLDAPDERTEGWDNPPHRSHLCHACGSIWRPADVPTIGVATIKTTGKADTWTAGAPAVPAEQLAALVAEGLDYFDRAGDVQEREYVAAFRAALAARQPVGQHSPDLHAAARDFYNGTVGDTNVRISCPSAEHRDRVFATGERLRAALTAPPAKAVALGQFRAAVMHFYGATKNVEMEGTLGELLDLIDAEMAATGAQEVGRG